MSKAKVITIVMNKGGTGKTETTLNLALGLAKKGKKVLLIDLDPSANATSVVLDIDNSLSEQGAYQYEQLFKENLKKGIPRLQACYKAMHTYLQQAVYPCDIHDVLEKELDMHQAIHKTRFEGLDIVPASNNLSTTDIKLKEAFNRSSRLRRAIMTIEEEYDFIIVDNQPFENSLTYNAVASCYKEGDLIIAPTKISLGGLQGIDSTLYTVLEWIKKVESLPYDFKLLITMKNRNGVDETWTKTLQDTFQEYVFDTIIRYQGKPVADASMHRRILLENTKSPVSQDYQSFVEEVYQL